MLKAASGPPRQPSGRATPPIAAPVGSNATQPGAPREIEDPFGEDTNDLPLEKICATIEQNLLGLQIGKVVPLTKPPRPNEE